MTQSAVSRQIGALEHMLGSQLFERRPHGLVLTETGAIYLLDVIDALERLSGSTVRIMGNRKGGGIVQVVSTPTFATLWLLPRLPEFYRRHPRIQIMLRTRSTPFNLLEANVDLAINMSFVNWPGTIADPLVTTSVVVVCSPEFKQRHGLKCPEDLIGLPLIQHYTMPNTWTDWLNEMGVAHPEPSVGQQFDQFTLATQAAVAGLGIASLSLGASHMRTALRVILPLIAPGMLAAAIFAFIHSFDEVVISSFVAGANLQTLPLRIWQDIQYQVDPVIAAISAMLMLIPIAALPLLRKRSSSTAMRSLAGELPV